MSGPSRGPAGTCKGLQVPGLDGFAPPGTPWGHLNTRDSQGSPPNETGRRTGGVKKKRFHLNWFPAPGLVVYGPKCPDLMGSAPQGPSVDSQTSATGSGVQQPHPVALGAAFPPATVNLNSSKRGKLSIREILSWERVRPGRNRAQTSVFMSKGPR